MHKVASMIHQLDALPNLLAGLFARCGAQPRKHPQQYRRLSSLRTFPGIRAARPLISSCMGTPAIDLLRSGHAWQAMAGKRIVLGMIRVG